ncbi:Ribonuclease 3 [Acaryochloris thomasi RCC1774]|uniref:Ribonuclease 3 n=1 Tax=Acaryochloris thomasi RCC1774 TaxID=1764569 RepID=A0A2W1JNE4_9CYAN|nr:ribonuclease III [Acaryochloris thomasi]PZD71664.1 Ribonuclease 3 [Acaryochloris thomasi RCC1774]
MSSTFTNPSRQRQLQTLISRLGLTDSTAVQWALLDLALTHPTASSTANYEQLEFVGDAVIRLLMAKILWAHNRSNQVGDWSAVRSALVSDRALADLARTYGLKNFLTIGPSAMGDPRGEASRLADAFEALLGALYLSTEDLSLIEPWLVPKLQQQAAVVRADPTYQNYKAALQQWTQAHYGILPEYRVQDTYQPQKAVDEDQRFAAEVWVQGNCLASGTGRSIKAAEKAAAEIAFLQLSAT